MHPRLADGQFFGEVLRREAVAGLVLSETGYAPHTEIPPHSHANPYICLVCEGAYTEVYGRQTRECLPHCVVFHPPGEVHAERFHATLGRSFNIELPAAWTDRVGLHSRVLERPLDFRGGQLAALAAKLYDEFQCGDAVTPLAVEGLTLELLARAARSLERPAVARRPPPWLREVRDLLNDRFADHSHFARTFKSLTGTTPSRYRRAARRAAG